MSFLRKFVASGIYFSTLCAEMTSILSASNNPDLQFYLLSGSEGSFIFFKLLDSLHHIQVILVTCQVTWLRVKNPSSTFF